MKATPWVTAILFATLCITGPNASAASAGETYAAIQYAHITYKEEDFEELNPSALVARLGRYLNANFALEGRFGFGLQDDSIDIIGIDVSLEIDTMLGIYGIGHLDLNESSAVYGLLGITRGEASASALGFSESADESDLSYGIGADIGLSNSIALNIEYVQYLDKSEAELNAIGLGVKFLF